MNVLVCLVSYRRGRNTDGETEEKSMNSLVVHHSRFGNTKIVAEAIAGELSSAGSSRTVAFDQIDIPDLQDIELLVMGTPTHRMNLPEEVRQAFKSWPKRSLNGKSVAAFDTSYKMSWWLARFTAARKLDRRLRKLGGKRIAGPETFHVEGREGPLYEGEIERASTWAASIREQLG
jgi:flavodoxin